MLTALAFVTLAIWVGLAFFWHGFWKSDVFLAATAAAPASWPSVAALVPARNEEATIAYTVAALMAQDYPGDFRIVVANDSSEDDTRKAALAEANGSEKVHVVDCRPLPKRWAGKLWALNEAQTAAGGADYYWLTDADIMHRHGVLRSLISAAEAGELGVTSELVRLRCQSGWEKLLVPAYNYYFALLYPFRAVADPGSAIAGAAGGSLLVSRAAIEGIGGFGAVRSAVIDDCALARAVKAQGGRIALGLAHDSHSLRSYERLEEFWAMVKRSAYTQLGHSPLLLAGTLAGLVLTFPAPWLLVPAGLAAGEPAGALAAAGAAALMWWTYRPSVRHFGLPRAWALSLPVAAVFYGAMTLASAAAYHFGGENRWRGRNIVTK